MSQQSDQGVTPQAGPGAFTPSPWTAHVRSNQTGTRYVFVRAGTHGHCVFDAASSKPTGYRPTPEDVANANLIAAAPELYAALEHILNGSLSLPRFAEDEARAAMAKARGEQAQP